MDLNHPLIRLGRYWRALKLFEAAGVVGDVDRLKAAAKDLDSQGRVEDVLYGYRDVEDQTVLHFASFGGKTDVCRYLIEEVKLDINARDALGETPLINATAQGHLGTVVYLLQMGANPDLANKRTFSPLHYAANKGDEEMLQLLLSKNANVDPLSLIGSPLQVAASKANEEIVKSLLDYKANPNLIFRHVNTPLMAAVLAKSFLCVGRLIKAGADPNADLGDVAPLAIAASKGEAEIVQCLLDAGAEPDATSKGGLTPVELAALNGSQQIVQILYPVTSKISTYPDWSIEGIMAHVPSEKARKQLEARSSKNSVQIKLEGDKAYNDEDYDAAIDLYTKYLEGDPWDALSNRSLCWAHTNTEEQAAADAENSIKLRPRCPSTYLKAGIAWRILGNPARAADTFWQGLAQFPSHKLLRRVFRETVDERLKLQEQGKM